MIIVVGERNKGKTTLIKSVFTDFILKLKPFSDVDYDFVAGATIGKNFVDIVVIVDLKKPVKCRLGIYSAGDLANDVKDVKNILIDKAKCNIIICAANESAKLKESILDSLKKIAESDDFKIFTVDMKPGLFKARKKVFDELSFVGGGEIEAYEDDYQRQANVCKAKHK